MPLYFHAANSIGLILYEKAHLNLVRPGIILYGLNPSSEHPKPEEAQPVLSWKTRIAFLKEAKADTPISYGATYRTPRKTRIAVLPVGYSSGYRVGFSNKASVIVHGIRCPVVGRVTMDQTLVDVGHVPHVRRWDEVTLIGKDGGECISAEELASLIDSIPYEIVCSINSRIPRIYKGI
jgi:alanine racemase